MGKRQLNAEMAEKAYNEFSAACGADGRTIKGVVIMLAEEYTARIKKDNTSKFKESLSEVVTKAKERAKK